MFHSSKYATFILMKAKDVVKLLKDDGWYEVDQKGSHLQLKHLLKPGKVTIPMHSGDVPKGTLHAILKQAGLK